MSDQSVEALDQHPSDSLAFREHFQCPDEVYRSIRLHAIDHMREETDWGECVGLSKMQLKRLTFEDGVVSFEATHPHVEHEDNYEGEIGDEDPHADDHCIVCGVGPDAGRMMHPVVSVENGCVCGECVNVER